jgi:ribonuclease H2 subunit B
MMLVACDGSLGNLGLFVLVASFKRLTNNLQCILSCHQTEGETQYLFIDGQLHEFNWFKERYGSWFLGDYVCEGMIDT